jgi:hypothetical protein
MEKEVKFLSHQYELAKDPQYKALLRKKQMYLVDFLNTPHRPHAKDLSGISSYDIAVSFNLYSSTIKNTPSVLIGIKLRRSRSRQTMYWLYLHC